MPDLDIRDLTIEYKSGDYVVRAIDRLDLFVSSGELVVMLGPSGCGKTTLLSVLAGILKPQSGSVRFGDTDVSALKERALTEYRRATVGVVFQAFNLIPSLTALENVQVPLLAAKTRPKEARARAVSLLHRVELSDRMAHKPGKLSGGQQQRVAIARALAHDPTLVLADEPTAHLDYIQVEGILRLLRELANSGRTIIVATHDERLLPLADRIVELAPRGAVTARPPEHQVLGAGNVIFRQGDAGDLIYIVWRGEIELVRNLGDGSEQVIDRVTGGRYFGELAPIFGLPRSVTARATMDTVVTGYTPTDFRKQMGSPSMADMIVGADMQPSGEALHSSTLTSQAD
ncbi:MAG: ATP-binding cassette domain-containing protein [Actinobacteria bacterium]|nr:ATP-binding cassette domain-containing protein [Actinomycetota bacterium]